MTGRLAAILVLTTMLAACREPGQERRDGGALGEVAARGERALSVVTGREDRYDRYERDDEYASDNLRAYERGVRDGLRDVQFNRDERSEAYARGYEAGLRETRRDRQRLAADTGSRDRRTEARREERRVVEDRHRREYRDGDRDAPRPEYDRPPEDYRRAGFAPSGPPRSAPREGMRACAEEVERMFDLPSGSAAAVTSRPRDNGGFQIGVRAGPRQAVCVLSADGDVRSVDER